ncbi:hypothetical protein EYF80_066309 [Liparis tanakae]|uniref:Uncharacterized protein n=1 Tax=Liparis tanakae TaxID=230148 RepID=A0A4Z2E487_9TELE|nr:hypothetical protein EYF80_066309 [Liparis tanakae]
MTSQPQASQGRKVSTYKARHGARRPPAGGERDDVSDGVVKRGEEVGPSTGSMVERRLVGGCVRRREKLLGEVIDGPRDGGQNAM